MSRNKENAACLVNPPDTTEPSCRTIKNEFNDTREMVGIREKGGRCWAPCWERHNAVAAFQGTRRAVKRYRDTSALCGEAQGWKMTLRQACQRSPVGAICVQRFDDSLNSAIHITYRSLLRSSSMHEPRDPSLKVVSQVSFGLV